MNKKERKKLIRKLKGLRKEKEKLIRKNLSIPSTKELKLEYLNEGYKVFEKDFREDPEELGYWNVFLGSLENEVLKNEQS